jgi:CRP/FNR family transcriptional regulator, cyclic AMP receptor protein
MHERRFTAGTVITQVGQDGVAFFIIGSGTALVEAPGREPATLAAGDHFGEVALIDEGPRTARITAQTDLQCYGLTAWEFRPFVQDHPDVAWALLQTLVKRWRAD